MIESSNTNSVPEVVKKNFPEFAPGTGLGMRRVRFPLPFNIFRSHDLARFLQEECAGSPPFPSRIDSGAQMTTGKMR
jgi:hypothetical protein